MPSTRLGTICCRLGLASVAFLGAFFVLVASGQRGGETFFSNGWLSTTILTATITATVAGGVGITAVLKDSERALSVVATVAFGLLVFGFALGEVIFPH